MFLPTPAACCRKSAYSSSSVQAAAVPSSGSPPSPTPCAFSLLSDRSQFDLNAAPSFGQESRRFQDIKPAACRFHRKWRNICGCFIN
ncbi:hypothetical protein AB3S75_023700 [Citrus x aurantiifolia]